LTSLEHLTPAPAAPRVVRESAILGVSAFCYLGHIIFQGRTAPSELGAFGGLMFLVWAIARREAKPSLHILYYPLALYGIASSISSFAHPSRLHEIGEVSLWSKMLVFPTAIILFRNLPRTRGLALAAHGIFGSWIALAGLYQFFVLDRRDLEHRITGTSTHVMTYSGLLLPLSLLFIILAIHQRKAWLTAVAGLTTFALLLTFTRSAWLGWAVAAFVVVILGRPRWIVWAATLFLLFLVVMPMSMFERLTSSFDTRQESNLDRIRMFQAGVEIIRDYPLLGVGPANIKEVYPLYRRHDAPRFRIPHLHNNVVQIWAERGVLALVGHLLLLYFFLRECALGWHGPGRQWAEAGVAVAVALAYAGLFEFNFGDTEVFLQMLDLMALVVVMLESAGPRLPETPAAEPLPPPLPLASPAG
jgi:O-antigen ligase